MIPVQPIRLNKEWVISSNRQVFLLKVDSEICGYCKSKEEAESLIRSLGTSIEAELITEKHGISKVTMGIVPGDKALASKVVIYEQPLGYVYNSYPKAKHVITWTTSHKCYYFPKLVTGIEVPVQPPISWDSGLDGAGLISETENVTHISDSPCVAEPVDMAMTIAVENQGPLDDAEDEDLSSSASQELPETETKFEKKARKIITRIFTFLE